MNYNKSAILAKAHKLQRVYGLSMSESLSKSWAMAKLTELEKHDFYHEMKDRWDNNDYDFSRKLHKKIHALKAEIYPTIIKTVVDDPLSEKERAHRMEVLQDIAERYGEESTQYFRYHLNHLALNEVKTYTCEVIDTHAYDAAI